MKVTPGAVRAHDDVALVGGRDVEHRGQGAVKIGQADAAPEQFLLAGGVRPGHVKARGSDTGESVEHRPRFGVSGVWRCPLPCPARVSLRI